MKITFCNKDAKQAIKTSIEQIKKSSTQTELPTVEDLIQWLPHAFSNPDEFYGGIKVVFSGVEDDEYFAMFYVPARVPTSEKDLELQQLQFDEYEVAKRIAQEELPEVLH